MTDKKIQKIYDQRRLEINQDYHKEYDKNGMKSKEKLKKWIEEVKKVKSLNDNK